MKHKYKNLIILIMLVVSSVIYGQVKAEIFTVKQLTIFPLSLPLSPY
jgi:hypothetical protein